jgi:hypothetical protein
MKSFELLVRENPNLSGAEIMKLHLKEIEEDKKAYKKSIESELNLINSINTKGLFVKGAFGSNQKYVWSFRNAQLVDREIYVDVEKILIFRKPLDNQTFSVTIEIREFNLFRTYDYYKKENEITSDEFNRIKNMYLNTWDQI